MSVGLKHSHYWEQQVPPPAHSPHDWRAVWRTADPRLRKRLLRGILPEELEAMDTLEVDRLLNLLDDLDDLPV